MDEILSLFGFSIGASLGVGVVRSLADGSRPVVRELFKAGIRAFDSVGNAASAARESVSTEDPAAQTRRGTRRRAQPEKIIIAHQ